MNTFAGYQLHTCCITLRLKRIDNYTSVLNETDLSILISIMKTVKISISLILCSFHYQNMYFHPHKVDLQTCIHNVMHFLFGNKDIDSANL